MNIVLKEEYVHDNKISNVIKDFSIKEKKVIIVDADYIPFLAGYNKDEEEITLEDYYSRVDDTIFKLINSIEEYFEIDTLYLCVKGRNNFRKQIYSDYKKSRKERDEITETLHTYLVEKHNAIEASYGEADDLVFTMSETIEHNGIVVSPDKDLLQIPSVIYNPTKNIWFKIDNETAMYNIALQVLIGDSADNIRVNYGLGPKKASKIIQKGMSKYQYIKTIYNTYIQYNGKEAKSILKQTYILLKLININRLS
jgi:5'-3' exonuclease